MFSDWGLSWGGWMDNRRGEWWLLAQLLLIAAHLLPPTPAPATWGLEIWPRPLFLLGAMLLITGLALAGLAFKSLGSSLSPLPTPKPGNQLILNAAYQRCRHPMYQAVLMCSLGMAVAFGSLLHLFLLLGLILVLGGKARLEEQALLQLHRNYALYQRHTPAIVANVPWLDWRS